VGLVYREQHRRAGGQHLPHVVSGKLLGSEEDKSGLAVAQQLACLPPGGSAGRRVDRHRRQAPLL
jgi:hypothetical protein